MAQEREAMAVEKFNIRLAKQKNEEDIQLLNQTRKAMEEQEREERERQDGLKKEEAGGKLRQLKDASE